MNPSKLRVYIDSNVFIFGKEDPNSNSRIILDLAEEGKIIPVVSYLTIEELREYFTRRYNRETAINEIYYLISLPTLEIIPRDKTKKLITKYKGIVPDKDLPHLVSAITANADCIVTYNRHFTELKTKEHIKILKQSDFIKLFGIKPQPTDY